jgi:hypothetical protein
LSTARTGSALSSSFSSSSSGRDRRGASLACFKDARDADGNEEKVMMKMMIATAAMMVPAR